jgi:hypothetical protein
MKEPWLRIKAAMMPQIALVHVQYSITNKRFWLCNTDFQQR